MPPITKIKKEDIIKGCFEIAKKEGLDSINARRIAKELKCSVQPIFSNFKNMQDLKQATLNKINLYFYDFIIKLFDDSTPKYKQVGINYIKFAKEEPTLFKILFLENNELNSPILENNESFEIVKQFIEASTNLDKNKIDSFHYKMWIFTHGLATIVSSNNQKLTNEDISTLLSSEFNALMLLEKNNEKRKI